LLLAFRIFLRDRTNAERRQVDLVGIWNRPEFELRPPWEPPHGIGKVVMGLS